MGKASERAFQDDIIEQMKANGWLEGKSKNYNREAALYEEDLFAFVKSTQPEEWEKFCQIHPKNPEDEFLKVVIAQLEKANIHATDQQSRTYGTLGVLRHGVRSYNTRFILCQFQPEHDLNPDISNNYKKNILRLVPELVYSPHAKPGESGRIDLVLFVNGLPVATLELKSEFKQIVSRAITQYKTTRHPIDPTTKKREPLLSFKRGALVHFAVSQYQVYMTTQLRGKDTYFLPFNQGTSEGGAGNDIPDDIDQYATSYLWNQVLLPVNFLNILGRFIHLHIEDVQDAKGLPSKKEVLIFPRFHQWDVVTKLIQAAKDEGIGEKYLVQHSAGSGKSNSIAWTAHQLSTLRDKEGERYFASIIVVTDRNVLDAQLQDTIYQFEHAEGVVERISDRIGTGSKSEKLAQALEKSKPIIIVTIQTFPYVMAAIEKSKRLRARNFAIIADEAHSSQASGTAKQLKKVLTTIGTAEDALNELAEKEGDSNLNYYAFTATPKAKTLEVFGRRPNPELVASNTNKPEPYHVYSMRQAIEEGFILDVLKNYTSYQAAYLFNESLDNDQLVDSKKAALKLKQWVRLHEHNISEKVKVMVEHFRENVAHLLNHQAKAMIVTSSRKEAVRYKLSLDNYVAEKKYNHINAMVAFSGEVQFDSSDNDSSHLIGQKFTEANMNPGLKGREMRKAFDSNDFQIMIVANKFQTGFDQPKLCAMYVDKKLGGVECVQTLSRLNRTYPGKQQAGTFILDFFNDPDDILEAFQPYFETAILESVSDPNAIFSLFTKIKTNVIIQWHEVEQFSAAYYDKNRTPAAIANLCKPAARRWQSRYESAVTELKKQLNILNRSKASQDPTLIAHAENCLNEARIEKDSLDIFKKDLGTYDRLFEFLSHLVDFEDEDLEKLRLFAKHLRPMLVQEAETKDDIDLSAIELTHYRLSKTREQDLKLKESSAEMIYGGGAAGTATPKSKEEELLSVLVTQLNTLFSSSGLGDDDRLIAYAHLIKDEVAADQAVASQLTNNTVEQILLGDFPKALENALLKNSDEYSEEMMILYSEPHKMDIFKRVILDLLMQ